MSEFPRDIQEMAMATWNKDLDGVRRILTRKPNLSHCLDGYSRSGGDDNFTILKMLLAAGADINDRSFGDPLIHSLVDVIADSQGSRYGTQPDRGPVGQMIELGADPLLRDAKRFALVWTSTAGRHFGITRSAATSRRFVRP